MTPDKKAEEIAQEAHLLFCKSPLCSNECNPQTDVKYKELISLALQEARREGAEATQQAVDLAPCNNVYHAKESKNDPDGWCNFCASFKQAARAAALRVGK